MTADDYWKDKHKKYLGEDWIDKPTIFAKEITGHLPPRGDLLELGAGHGQDSRFFADLGYKITSTDFSQTAADFAKEKSKKYGDQIKFGQLDLTSSFPFTDSTFDIVYSHLSIQFFDDTTTAKIFNEIYRVLRPNGILAIMVNTLADPEVTQSKNLGQDLFETPSGLIKRFYSPETLSNFTNKLFQTILLDEKGETHKDQIKTLIRFVGKKI